MAETTTTQTTTTPSAKPAAKRASTARKPAKPRATTRSTAAKSPSKSTARRSRTIAANETREAAEANVRAARTTALRGRNVAERAALVYVGATLEARDRAVALVNDLRTVTTSRTAAEKRIDKFERRGTTARNRFERDVRKARTRLERELRGRRRDVGNAVQTAKERVTAIA
jgi:hypothetical protein